VLFRHKDLSTDEKGEKMNIIFAMTSIILVYPILSVLPLGITAKQRFLIVCISLIIAISGILALELYATWQALLLMVALAFLVSILISKRMPGEEAKTVEPHFQQSGFVILEEDVEDDSVIEKTPSIIENEKIKDMDFEEEGLEEIASILQFDEQMTSSKIEEDDLNSKDINDSLYDKLQSHLYVAASVESDIEDVIAHKNVIELDSDYQYVEFEDLKELEGFNDFKELNEDKVATEMGMSSYLSEIEKLLLEEEIESLPDKEDKPMQKAEEKEQSTKEFKLDKLY
jgi:hypothetical protein